MDMNLWTIRVFMLLVANCFGFGENKEVIPPTRTAYTPTQLLLLYSHGQSAHAGNTRPNMDSTCIAKEPLRRKRGKAGGFKKRMRRQTLKPFLPSIIVGNVQSLNNKMDEVCSNIKYLSEFWNVSLLSFTEIWLAGSHVDAHAKVFISCIVIGQ